MLHRRQFVLGPRAVEPRPGWRARRVGALTLSHCPDLRIEPVADAEGAEWCLIGLVSQSDPGRPDPPEAIRRSATGAVRDLYQTWAGRWMLVGNGRVHLDAAGLLGCYYRLDGGECWASSSAVLLIRPEEAGTVEIDPRPLVHRHGVEWYPPPRSRFGPIRRLLPSQVLDLARGAVEPRPLLPPLERHGYARIVERLEERLVTALARLPRVAGAHDTRREDARTWVPLTSGLDSRLVLAIAARLGMAQGTYTHERPGLSIGDRLYPPRLARAAGLPHRLVRPGRFSARAEREYDEHTGRQSADVDRRYYARGHWRFLRPGDLILRGGGFESGRCFYYHRLREASGGALPDPEDVAAWLGEPRSSTAVAGLREWLAHAAADPIEGLDWRDRFYLEQRLGGWLSALEQSLDLIDATRFYVANSAAVYGLLLSLDPERRRTGEHQRELIRRLAPRLLELPFNPDEDRFTRWERLRHRWREDPLAVVRAAARRVARRHGAPRQGPPADPASSR